MNDDAQSPHRKFTFDNEFEGPPGAAPSVYRRLHTDAELDEAAQRARAEGMAAAMARVEAQTAQALSELAETARAALTTLSAAAHEHRAGAAELALACARQIAEAACERFPEAPLQSALTALAREIEATPRLILRAPPQLIEPLTAASNETAEAIGYAGQILVRADPNLAKAAFVLDWGDGMAAFDPAAAAARVAEALEGALAAEGLHAEALALPTSSTDRP